MRMKTRESAENYLKSIFLLQKKLGNVRSIDVANELGVSKPSVSNAIKKLRKEGFVDMDEKRNLVLTEDGLHYAAAVFERHVVLENFLKDILKVEESVAHDESCRLEHLLSEETVSKINGFCSVCKKERRPEPSLFPNPFVLFKLNAA